MDDQAYQILAKVHKIISAKEPIAAETRAYISGLLETLLTMYQTTEAQEPPKRSFLEKLTIHE